MSARPLWPDSAPHVLRDWSLFAEDLRTEFERRGARGIVGVGHSLGAVTSLLAAAVDPGLFSVVVAVDPLILTGARSLFWGAVKTVGLAGRIPLVRGARRRRVLWSDRDVAWTTYSSKKIFSSWDPEVLDDYLEAGPSTCRRVGFACATPGSGRRASSPRRRTICGRSSERCRCRPSSYRVSIATPFSMPRGCEWRGRCRRSRTLVMADSSHFVPMERPRELARVIVEFLESIKDEEA